MIKFEKILHSLTDLKEIFFRNRLNVEQKTPEQEKEKELVRLRSLPKNVPNETYLLDVPLGFLDSESFLLCYDEIFVRQNYLFYSDNAKPYIIDCGANIGLSVLYFKRRFPYCNICAIEADPNIFDTLLKNITRLQIEGVTLLNNAVWTEEGEIDFFIDGGVSGKIQKNAQDIDKGQIVKVKTVKIESLLTQQVDLLKIDIEGAELEVLKGLKTQLHKVDKIFVEYHSTSAEAQRFHELLELLTDAGFRYQIKEASAARLPFIEGHQRMNLYHFDLQLDVYAFRV